MQCDVKHYVICISNNVEYLDVEKGTLQNSTKETI